MDRFEEIITKYHFEKRIDNPIVTFEQVEKMVGFKLPEDYKSFVLKYLGFEGFMGEHYINLWSFEKIVDLNIDFNIFKYLPKTLGIGGNGSGEYIAIEQLNNNKLRIVLSPFIIEKEAHLEIGTSFTDFLERLDNGINWFE